MKPFAFHPDAERELDEAVAYYQLNRGGLGIAFQAAVEGLISIIRETPDRYPMYGQTGLQKAIVKKFPYNIFYKNYDANILIVAVAHQKRRPGYWLSRTEP